MITAVICEQFYQTYMVRRHHFCSLSINQVIILRELYRITSSIRVCCSLIVNLPRAQAVRERETIVTFVVSKPRQEIISRIV